MRRKIEILMLSLLLALTGCATRRMGSSVPTTPGAAVPAVNTTDMAKAAQQAYDLILSAYSSSDTKSYVLDMDENGIPEMVLVTSEMTSSSRGGRTSDAIRYVYSVYTYRAGKVKTLISKRVTRAEQAAGNYLVVGADKVDGKPVVVTMYTGETTGVNFGDPGYEGEIYVEAVDPFADKVLATLSQQFRGESILSQTPSNFYNEISRFSAMTLDENGVLTFSPAVIAQSIPDANTENTGSGGNSGYIELSTAADLEKLRTNPNGNFVLVQDITVSNDFQPFDKFGGTLDGRGYWISGFQLNMDSGYADGLFTTFEASAEVKNLNVEIYAAGNKMPYIYITGLVGNNLGSISNCFVQSYISGTRTYDPITSVNDGQIENCTASTIIDDVDAVRGLVGNNNGVLKNCVIDINASQCPLITGIADRNWGTIEGCNVTVVAEDIERLVCAADQNYGPVRKCGFYAWLTAPTGQTAKWTDCGSYGYGSDFDETNTIRVWDESADMSAGSGTKSDPYRLREPQDLELLRFEPKAYFRLEADIDFSGSMFTPIGEFSGELDGNGHAIRGIEYSFYHGVNNDIAALIRNVMKAGVVENLTLECSIDAGSLEGTDAAGITIRNEGTIRNCNVTVNAINCYAFGGITRNNTDTGKIEGCTVNITTDECKFVGGIAEYQSGAVSDCNATVTLVDTTSMGGISYANKGTIRNCIAAGTIRTSYTNGCLGGLVGENLSGTISGSKATITDELTLGKLPTLGK